jgi:hypothetical protein
MQCSSEPRGWPRNDDNDNDDGGTIGRGDRPGGYAADQARAGLGRQRKRVVDQTQQLCESKAILSYAASIFPIRQRKGNVKASEERMTAPFVSDSKGVFVDLHSHGGYVGWPWGFVNWRTPNNADLGALRHKFASFSRYGLWVPKMPNRLCESEHLCRDCAYHIH